MSLPLTVIVLTLDEALNLGACLASVTGLGAQIFVVDSGSTDGTLDIARRHGAICVSHAFDTHALQWRWALASLPVSTEWVLALDADQRVTPELGQEIARALTTPATGARRPAGYYLRRRQIFRGRWIKHGGYYPKHLLRLFRHGEAWVDVRDLVDHHFLVKGEVEKLRGDLIEDNQKEADISVWVAKHTRYAALQARQEYEGERAQPVDGPRAALFGSPDERTRWLKAVWARLPLYVRPSLYFFYRFVLRLGFLDGREGFVFHAMQAFWYRLLVDVKLDELRRAANAGAPAGRERADRTGER
jgi:glycosyltransferase involved in cell wall biosynthesis